MKKILTHLFLAFGICLLCLAIVRLALHFHYARTGRGGRPREIGAPQLVQAPRREGISSGAGVCRAVVLDIADGKRGMAMPMRLAKLRGLPETLTENECQKLAEYLRADGKSPPEYLLVNNVMNKLRNRMPPWEPLTELLLGIMQNSNADVVVRKYAAQHLRAQYERGRDKGILEAYWREMETSSPVAAEAMLAVRHLMPMAPDAIPPLRLADAAVALAEKSAIAAPERATALAVAASLGSSRILPLAAKFAADEHAPTVLRLASIHALHKNLSSTEAQPILEKAAESRNALVADAARKAWEDMR